MRFLALGFCLAVPLIASQPVVRADTALPAGTAISVKLTEGIDSERDPFGKQYAASIAAPVDLVGGQTIAAGSPATVVLIHNNSGWLSQLAGVTINGRKFRVTSGAGTVILLQAPNPSNKPASALATLKEMGTPVGQGAGSTTSGQRVLLPAATELRFVLINTGTAAPATRAPSRRATPTSARETASATPESASQTGVPYLCRANDAPDRGVPISYFIADVFETSDNLAEVEKEWREYLVATYPYRFAHNNGPAAHCTRLNADTYSQRDTRERLEQEWKSEKAQIVETRWHYRIGPPPRPAASLPASTPP